LAKFQPDLIKIDMELVRNIASSPAKQAIISGIIGIAAELGIEVLAEGVEDQAELAALSEAGIRLFQGYLFAKPDIERFRTDAEISNLPLAA
jgi:EAL domain-containing protein (putative c-di-GMP-specific phosphodiesterase class I)